MIKDIFFLFLKSSLLALGGGFVFIGFIELEIKKKSWDSLCDIPTLIAVSTSLPGPIITNLSYLIGKSLKGSIGGLTAILGAILPPFLIIYFLAPLLMNQGASNYFVATFLRGGLIGVMVFVLLTASRWICSLYKMGAVSFISYVIITTLMLMGIHPLFALSIGFIVNISWGGKRDIE